MSSNYLEYKIIQWRTLHDLGLCIFPLQPLSKTPYGPWKQFQTARPSWEELEAFLKRNPDANLGILTGKISGIVAVDFDSEEAFRAAEAKGLGDPLLVKTGKGYHAYYRSPNFAVRNSVKILDDVDIRGEGGYVVAPTSVHENGHVYEWLGDQATIRDAELPDWMCALLQKPDATNEASAVAIHTPERLPEPANDVGPAADILEHELEKVRLAANGTRNEQLNKSAFTLGQIAAEGRVNPDLAKTKLKVAALEAGLDAAEAEKTIKSGFEAGLQTPRNRGSADYHPEPSEVVFAEAFTERHGGNVRFCHTAGCWYYFKDGRWHRDELGWVKYQIREIVSQVSGNNAKFKRAAVVSGVECLLKSDPKHSVSSEFWDKSTFLLGTPDGTIDLKTGAFRKAVPEDGITMATACSPAVGEPTRWKRFLYEAAGGDQEVIDYLQIACGYMLTGDTREHSLFFIYGPGGNGKSVFLNTVAGILCDYATTASMETFTHSKLDKHPTDLAMLKGARLVSASETESGKAWAEAKIKQMTGGDPITARFMRQDFFTYRPQFKLMIVGNHEPKVSFVDDAMKRRFNMLPFINKPENPDRQLESKLKEEWPQILQWMIEGCLRWQQEGLKQPEAVRVATEEYFDDQDVLSQWLEERCILDPGNKRVAVSCQAAFSDWHDYAETMGEYPGISRTFGSKIKRLGVTSKVVTLKNGKKARYYIGLKLIENENDNEPHSPHGDRGSIDKSKFFGFK